jgi:photosystem II stability/assembly factor-like uncharacterized protein
MHSNSSSHWPNPFKTPLACAWLTGLAALAVASAAPGAQLSWRTMPTEAYPKKRDDIVFVNAKLGFYGTGKGRLFKSVDGGRTWTLAWEHTGTFIRSLGFIDQNLGFLGNLGAGLGGVTDTTPLYRTRDGGESWEPVGISGEQVPGICAIDILKARAIFEGALKDRVIIDAAGRANGPAKLLRSEDAGEHWSVIDLSERAGMILDVKFLDPQIGFVFAATSADVSQSHALILRTTDGGRSWKDVYRSARSGEIIWKASFPTQQVGYATIQSDESSALQQRIVKSVDRGRHWTELPLVRDKSAQEFGIGFVDVRHGWVGTAAGGYETTDGGSSWHVSDLATKANKIRTHASDGTSMVYAIGSAVQLYGDAP